jgi:hypothetical protein
MQSLTVKFAFLFCLALSSSLFSRWVEIPSTTSTPDTTTRHETTEKTTHHTTTKKKTTTHRTTPRTTSPGETTETVTAAAFDPGSRAVAIVGGILAFCIGKYKYLIINTKKLNNTGGCTVNENISILILLNVFYE